MSSDFEISAVSLILVCSCQRFPRHPQHSHLNCQTAILALASLQDYPTLEILFYDSIGRDGCAELNSLNIFFLHPKGDFMQSNAVKVIAPVHRSLDLSHNLPFMYRTPRYLCHPCLYR